MAVRYKYCAVPMCQSSTVNSPDKKFITIPRDVTRRKKWFTAMGRYKPLADKTTGYCCCDHFDVFCLYNYNKDYLMGDIKDVEVKEEVEDFVHVPESQSSNLILQDIQPILEIKEEPIDDSVKIEEGCVSEMKLEDEDRPPLQEIETVYLNESNHIVVSPTI
ncbi:thap-type zinc finger superfamily [Holotrichia oblita]|uniref:Thap-type zinc finger superfamily n=1 Tax=Holotrichia oblita TaxID=644536 RepID=A0ACB9T0T8_HOLOL|nr:thap-type zinc finger superfamily [Holotrichia oblita]